jgi:hypothetical protein
MVGVVRHVCNASTQEADTQEDWEFEARLGYIARDYLKKKKNSKK